MQKEDLLTEAGAMELAAAFAAMAEHGVFDFMVQVVPDAERRPNFFAVMPLAESATLSTTAIELVSRIEGGDVDSHNAEVEGWTVQRLGPADSDLTNLGLAVQGTAPTDVLLLVTDRDAILHLASPDSQHLLKEIVGEKPTDGQTDDDTARFRKSGFSAQLRMADLVRTLYREEAEGLLEEVYGKARMEAGNLEDGITISMFEEDHKVQIRTEFECDNIVLGAAYYMMILGIFGEWPTSKCRCSLRRTICRCSLREQNFTIRSAEHQQTPFQTKTGRFARTRSLQSPHPYISSSLSLALNCPRLITVPIPASCACASNASWTCGP